MSGVDGNIQLTNGALNVSGGNLSMTGVDGDIQLTNGALNVSGGNFSMSGVDGNIEMGCGAQTTGVINMTGGNLSISGQDGDIQMGCGAQSTGVINMSGGSLSLSARSGQLQFGGGSGSSGTLNLGGGTFSLAGSILQSGNSSANFGGGVWQFYASQTIGLTGMSVFASGDVLGSGTATGGAVIDTEGCNVAFTQSLGHAGSSAVDGGLSKVGNGLLTLAAADSFTGADSDCRRHARSG